MPSCTSPTSQPCAGTVAGAEGELAGRGDLQAHLLLDVGHVDAVARAQRAGLGVEVELGDDEQRQPLGAGLRALGAGQDQVDDVVAQVVLGRRDEPLHAGEVPRAVVLAHCLGPPGADVGTRVRLGEHHRGAPALLEHDLGQPPLLAVPTSCRTALIVVAVPYITRAGLLPSSISVAAQRSAAGAPKPPSDSGRSRRNHSPRARHGTTPRTTRERHRVRRRVEHRRMAIGVDVGLGDRTLGQPTDLGEHAASRVGVHLLERAGAEAVLGVQELEEVELEVPEIRGVVAHGCSTTPQADRRVPVAALGAPAAADRPSPPTIEVSQPRRSGHTTDDVDDHRKLLCD